MTDQCIWPDCPKTANVLKVCRAHAMIIRNELDNPGGSVIRSSVVKPEPKARPEVVYYVELEGFIKIGFTASVESRLLGYPPMAKLLATEPGGRDLERERHGQFRAHLASGREWFRDCEDIRGHINTVLATHGEPALSERRRNRKQRFTVDVRTIPA